MYIEYDDILEAAATPPQWWLYGVPRFSAFRPENVFVYAREVALVQTQCQVCHTRYDVGVTGYLRAKLALYDGLQIGDPPNAFHWEGCSGTSMMSEEVTVLEFWRKNASYKWERDQTWERNLDFYDYTEPLPEMSKSYLLGRDNGPAWYEARDTGDTKTMKVLLEGVNCELVDEVIEMLELERRVSEAQVRPSLE